MLTPERERRERQPAHERRADDGRYAAREQRIDGDAADDEPRAQSPRQPQ